MLTAEEIINALDNEYGQELPTEVLEAFLNIKANHYPSAAQYIAKFRNLASALDNTDDELSAQFKSNRFLESFRKGSGPAASRPSTPSASRSTSTSPGPNFPGSFSHSAT